MARTHFLRPLAALVFLALIPAGAACNGHVISLGEHRGHAAVSHRGRHDASATSASPRSRVPPAAGPTRTSAVPRPRQASPTACGAWEQDPFLACAPGQTTYPDLALVLRPQGLRRTASTRPGRRGPVPPPLLRCTPAASRARPVGGPRPPARSRRPGRRGPCAARCSRMGQSPSALPQADTSSSGELPASTVPVSRVGVMLAQRPGLL